MSKKKKERGEGLKNIYGFINKKLEKIMDFFK